MLGLALTLVRLVEVCQGRLEDCQSVVLLFDQVRVILDAGLDVLLQHLIF